MWNTQAVMDRWESSFVIKGPCLSYKGQSYCLSQCFLNNNEKVAFELPLVQVSFATMKRMALIMSQGKVPLEKIKWLALFTPPK